MNELIQIKLKCFSQVKYALGQSELIIPLPRGSSTDDLKDEVRKMAKGKLDSVSLRVAVNRAYSINPKILFDGDEVALIPPVQGG